MNEDKNQPETWQPPVEAHPVSPYVPVASDTHDDVDLPQEAASDEQFDTAPLESESDDDTAVLRWDGTEYLHQERSMQWFVVVGIVTLVLMVLAIVVLHSITFAILIPVMAVALFIYARRPPEILHYILSRKGLHIGDKLITYSQLKSFGVVSHNDVHSIVLTPRKRFQIGQTIYFPEEIGEQLVDFLAARLPMKEVSPDVVDRLLNRIHL